MTSSSSTRKQAVPQLRVVFDTNILYTGSASDLVQMEASKLIKESSFPDLEIQWYLPDLVRHERQFQMQKRALELLPGIAKVERLLGHNLAITQETLLESVEKAVSQRRDELNFMSLPLDAARVDWNRVAMDSAYRRAPFEDGEKEKGFRDCVIVECFLQLVADSPKTAKTCRVVLVTNDGRLTEAVQSRVSGAANVSILSSLEELKGLINTLVSQVDESFLASIREKARELFFTPKDESTLFYKEKIETRLEHTFEAELRATPAGASDRSNGTWTISGPNFVKKVGRRVHWASRVSVEVEASKLAPSKQQTLNVPTLGGSVNANVAAGQFVSSVPFTQNIAISEPLVSGYASEQPPLGNKNFYQSYILNLGASRVTTHKGTDAYDVLWSADVTTARDLRKPTVDEIKHLGVTWESVT